MTGTHLFDQWTLKDWIVNTACVILFPCVWIPLLVSLVVAEQVVLAPRK